MDAKLVFVPLAKSFLISRLLLSSHLCSDCRFAHVTGQTTTTITLYCHYGANCTYGYIMYEAYSDLIVYKPTYKGLAIEVR